MWVPPHSFLVVSSPNHRWTRLSQDELVGVKCSTNRGWASSQRLNAGVLCVEARPALLTVLMDTAGAAGSVAASVASSCGQPRPSRR